MLEEPAYSSIVPGSTILSRDAPTKANLSAWISKLTVAACPGSGLTRAKPSSWRRIQAAGGATRTRVRDRSRAAGRRAHVIAVKLSSRAAQAAGEKQAAVARATGELADLAERAAAEARRLLASARRALRRAEAKAAARAAAGLKAVTVRRRLPAGATPTMPLGLASGDPAR